MGLRLVNLSAVEARVLPPAEIGEAVGPKMSHNKSSRLLEWASPTVG